MPVYGSYKDGKGFHAENVKSMCIATTRESVEKIKEMVQDRTPWKTTKLMASIHTTPTTKPYPTWYRAKVTSEDEKVGWIENGVPPHLITPRTKQALDFGGPHPYHSVEHPGVEGFHMFSRGGNEFQYAHAERIAKANARLFLGARTSK